MNAHRAPLDSAAAVIEASTRVHGRIARVALGATPSMRLHLLGELALVEMVLDSVEAFVIGSARGLLEPPTRKQLPRGRALLAARRAS
jgi:hypothetical protein